MQKTIAFQHTTVAYEDTGKGKPVIFIHGFAEDGTIWKHQVALLQEYYRVIVPDLPGSGLSPLMEDGADSPSLETSPSMETFAELVRSLLRHERIEKCCIIGHSMGGYITLAFAALFPECLCGFGLFHSTAFADSPEKQQARKRGIAFIQENGAQAFLKQSIPLLFGDRYKAAHGDEMCRLIQRNAQFNGVSLIRYYEAMLRRPDRRNVLSTSQVPVLLMIGEQDNAIPLNESLQLTTLAELTFVYLLEQTAHMGMWESTEKTADALLEYLAFAFRKS